MIGPESMDSGFFLKKCWMENMGQEARKKSLPYLAKKCMIIRSNELKLSKILFDSAGEWPELSSGIRRICLWERKNLCR